MTVGRIPSVEGGIQPTIFDAKADLLTATANDTPARLAVGSNFAFLQADSAQSTGLKWNLDDYTSYTPTVTAGTGSFTTVSATGAYTRIGKTCVVRVNIAITTNGTAAGRINCTMPFTSFNYVGGMVGTGRETGSTGKQIQAFLGGNENICNLWFYDNTYPGGSGYNLSFTITYQVA
jgi:hypothetical protein